MICDATGGFGTWNQNGLIVFSDPPKLLQSVSASGGAPKEFLPLDESRHENLQTAPYFLPDGNHFLYDIRTSGPERGIGWASLDGKERRFLVQNRNSPGSYTPNPAGGPGWIIYNSAGSLMAQPFDPGKGELKGKPMLIADGVQVGPTWSTSDTGIISFPHVPDVQRQLAWMGRDGSRLGALGDIGTLGGISAVAPNGKSIAFPRQEGLRLDIWLFDPARNAPMRLTFDGGTSPVWTSDGSRIIYSSFRQNVRYLVERPASGTGAETILKQFGNTDNRTPTAITTDGRWLSYREGGGGDGHALFISRPDGKIIPFSEPRVDSAAISPDGQWVAYATTAATGSEVFVQSAPKDVSGIANTMKAQISTTGGRFPKWRADGREMFYLSAEGMMMSVSVESSPGIFRPGTSKALFDAGDIPSYDVTPDGQRFLLAVVDGRALDTPITVILNWPLLLRN